MMEIQRSGPPKWSDQSLMEAAQRCANAYARVANKLYGCNLPVPIFIDFQLQDREPKAAGSACSDPMMISINMILYRDNIEEILNKWLPHEMGHLLQFDKFSNKGFATRGHGPEWREAMRKIGKQPLKHHDLDVSKSIAHYKEIKKKKKVVRKEA